MQNYDWALTESREEVVAAMRLLMDKAKETAMRAACFVAAFASVFALGFPVFYLVARYLWSPDYIFFDAGFVGRSIAVAVYLAIVFTMSFMIMKIYKRLRARFACAASTGICPSCAASDRRLLRARGVNRLRIRK